jgi:hypothetical protein
MNETTTASLDAQIRRERQREAGAGTGAAARRARLGPRPARPEECPQGHSYNDENTLWTGTGRRMCRACILARRLYTNGERTGVYEQGEPDGFPYQTR